MKVRELIDELYEMDDLEKEVIFTVGKSDYWSLYHKVIAVDNVLATSYHEGDFKYCEISISDEEDEFIETFFS